MRGASTNKRGDVPTYSATEARNKFSEVFDEAMLQGTVFVERRKRKVAIIPVELYDALMSLQAADDLKAAQEALEDYKNRGGTTLTDLIEELGLD